MDEARAHSLGFIRFGTVNVSEVGWELCEPTM